MPSSWAKWVSARKLLPSLPLLLKTIPFSKSILASKVTNRILLPEKTREWILPVSNRKSIFVYSYLKKAGAQNSIWWNISSNNTLFNVQQNVSFSRIFLLKRKLYEYMNTDEFSLEQIQIARKTFTFLLSSPFWIMNGKISRPLLPVPSASHNSSFRKLLSGG